MKAILTYFSQLLGCGSDWRANFALSDHVVDGAIGPSTLVETLADVAKDVLGVDAEVVVVVYSANGSSWYLLVDTRKSRR